MMESQGIFQIHPKPRQEPEVPARCSIVALRPVGLIARFAPHLRVAVSATGHASPPVPSTFTQNHAALCANIARFFLRLRARGPGLRAGAPPPLPRQGTEFPGPSTSTQNHASALARPRFARTLRASFCACGRMGRGYVRGLRPHTPARELSSLDLPPRLKTMRPP